MIVLGTEWTYYSEDDGSPLKDDGKFIALGVPDNLPSLSRTPFTFLDTLQHLPAEVQYTRLLSRHKVPEPHALLSLSNTQHQLHTRMHGEVIDSRRRSPGRSCISAGSSLHLRMGCLNGRNNSKVTSLGDRNGVVLGSGQKLRTRREIQGRYAGRVMDQRS